MRIRSTELEPAKSNPKLKTDKQFEQAPIFAK